MSNAWMWLVLAGCGSSTSTTPQAPGPIVQIAAGSYNACARLAGGTVWCWGRCSVACNAPSTIVDNEAPSAAPAAVVGIADATSVAIGDSVACASRTDGTVACWGSNYERAFGAASPDRSIAPVVVPGVTDVAEVAIARGMVCARRRDGTAMAWGGELGGGDRNPAQEARQRPTVIDGVDHALAVFAVGAQCCAQVADGTRCWHGGVFQRNGEFNFEYGAAVIHPNRSARRLGECGCVLDAAGVLACKSLALPGARTADGSTPEPPRNGCSIDRLEHVASFATHDQYGCAALADGKVACWGTLARQYGAYDPSRPLTTMAIPGRVTQIAIALFGTAYALDDQGRVWAWGNNTEHAIRGQTATTVPQPVQILP